MTASSMPSGNTITIINEYLGLAGFALSLIVAIGTVIFYWPRYVKQK